MIKEWNPAESYKRMVVLIESLYNQGDCNLYKTGPCSKALPLKENWYYNKEKQQK